jgi:hypothetical protein
VINDCNLCHLDLQAGNLRSSLVGRKKVPRGNGLSPSALRAPERRAAQPKRITRRWVRAGPSQSASTRTRSRAACLREPVARRDRHAACGATSVSAPSERRPECPLERGEPHRTGDERMHDEHRPLVGDELKDSSRRTGHRKDVGLTLWPAPPANSAGAGGLNVPIRFKSLS